MKTILFVLILMLPALPTIAATEVTLMVRPEAEIAAKYATLGDVATVQCADQALVERLVKTEVCSSPLPGMTRKVTKDQIVIALRKAGVSDGDVDLLCPAEIVIRAKSDTVTGQALFETAQAFVLAGKSLPERITVEAVRLPLDQAVPAGSIELRVRAGTKDARKGQGSLPVEIAVDGKVYRTVSVSMLVKVIAPVLVATQPIGRTSELTEANVALQERDITYLPSDIMLAQPAAGCTASTMISEGAIIRQNWVSAPLAIKTGDAVVVVVESGSVRVAERGTATQHGRPGDRIKVRMTGDNREVRGTVTEPGVVKISLGRRNHK